MESSLGRHAEGVVDSLLDGVLDFFQPFAEQMDLDRREGDDAPDLFDWEQVLCYLQAQSGQLERLGTSHFKVLSSCQLFAYSAVLQFSPVTQQ
jgi:hypothetical protein